MNLSPPKQSQKCQQVPEDTQHLRSPSICGALRELPTGCGSVTESAPVSLRVMEGRTLCEGMLPAEEVVSLVTSRAESLPGAQVGIHCELCGIH